MLRVQRTSHIVRMLLQVIFFAAPLLVTWFWLTDPSSWQHLLDMQLFQGAKLSFEQLSISQKLIGFTLSLVPLVTAMFLLKQLINLFRFYEAGHFFTAETVRCIKLVAVIALLWELGRPFYNALGIWVMTQQQYSLAAAWQFDVTDIRGIVVALLLYTIAWVMQEGVKLQQEQDLTV